MDTTTPFLLWLSIYTTFLASIFGTCRGVTEHPSSSSSTLQLVHLLYRHGDRSPTSDFPKDDMAHLWTKGLGQLTKVGMQQQYQLGKYLRRRYEGFLNSSFNTDEIFVRSTDKDRTLMSAYCNLAGFFYPSTDDVWNPDLMWQPIPVHTIPRMQDNLLYMESSCPKYMKIYEEFMKSKTYQDLISGYEDLINLVSEEAGTTRNIGSVASVYDNLFCRRAHNFSLPSWASEDVMLRLKSLEILKMAMYFYIPPLQRLKGGYLLWDIVENMKLKVTKPVTLRKLVMFSAHDSTLIALLMSLNVFNKILPPYASCLMIELHKDQDQSYFVQLFYRNSTLEDEPVILTLPGCKEKCLWDDFVRLTKGSVLANVELECELPKDTFSSPLLISVVFVIIFIIMVAMATLYFRYRRKDSYRHIQV